MSKKNKSFSLSPDNHEFLSNHDNASALVDDLVENYRKGADAETVGLELQLRQKKRERDEAEERAERLDNDVEELEQLIDGVIAVDEERLENAREALDGVPRETTNPAVQNWASRLDMTPSELLDGLDG